MNKGSALLDNSSAPAVGDELPIDRPRLSGFRLKAINASAALSALDSFLEGSEDEQRETFEYLKHALDETRAGQDERLLFPHE